MHSRSILWEVQAFWKSCLFIITPVLLLPFILMINTQEARCAYGVLVMAVYWLTETLPLAATALLPIVLFPLLGLVGAKDVVINYFKDTNMILLGGLMVALSIERSDLHRRIALRLLMVMGTSPQMLMLGFMLPTWFLSMWVSNTATTAMMIPVAEAVLSQLDQGLSDVTKTTQEQTDNTDKVTVEAIKVEVAQDNGPIEVPYITTTATLPADEPVQSTRPNEMILSESLDDLESPATKQHKKFSKGLCLAIAYAANVGGTGTLTGTGPNLVFKNIVDDMYERIGLETPITFASWMVWGIPGAMICLILVWLWLQILFIGFRKTFLCCKKTNDENQEGVKAIIAETYRSLGPIRFAEMANLGFFILLVLLWLTRNPGFVPGWGSLFTKGFVTDSVPAIFVSVLLFAFPSEKPNLICWRRPGEKPRTAPSLLDWETVSSKLPWGPIFILGGGFALADVCQKSGLSQYIAEQLKVFGDLPGPVIVLLVAALIAAATEVTSNTATSTLFLPILANLSISLGFHPLYLMLPATIAASFAFMLPVATPPNAIVFGYGHVKVVDMAKSGLLMNILCVLVVTLGTHTWGWAYFDLGHSPWAVGANTTTVSPWTTVMETTTL